MSGGGLNEYLQQASLLRLLAVMALVVAPHLARLPLWESALLVVLMVWRSYAALRQWRMPPRWFKVGLTLLAFAGVQMSFGRTHGQIAGVALFVAMLVLKLMEMRERRDVMIVVFLMYFILLTHFLYSQELWTILYLLLSAVAITAVLAEASHPRTALSPRVSWRLGSRMVLMALPLMVRAMRLSIEGVDRRLEGAARTLGAGRWHAFRTVSLPLALPGILAALVLGFARSIGEFGATITFVSNIPGETRTLPLAIYSALQVPGGETMVTRLALLSVALSLGALILSEWLVRRSHRESLRHGD